MKIRQVKIYIYISILSIITSLLLFELFAQFNKNLFPHLGWAKENLIEKKIKNCDKEKNIAILGDSFVEYFEGSNSNLVHQLQLKLKDYNLCNLGISGTSITTYINRFTYTLSNNIKLDKAIFFFYEGNDFFEYNYNNKNIKLDNIKIGNLNVFDYNSNKGINRELGFIKNFVKSTYSLNYIYRYIYKRFFIKKIDSDYVKDLYEKDLNFEVPFSEALRRMENTPDIYKAKLSAGVLNENFYKLALRNPNYHKELFMPIDDDFFIQKEIAYKHIQFINSHCLNHKIDCLIIIIPYDQFLFEKSKIKNTEIFRFNPQQGFGKSRIVKDIVLNFKNIHYPENIFEYSDFLDNDMHLNKEGNIKLANFVYNLIK